MSAKAKEPTACSATMRAMYDPDHTHTCIDTHEEASDHRCSAKDCGRYFKQGAR